MAQNTATGRMFEAMLESALIKSGYIIERQIKIGFRPGGSKHIIDVKTINRSGENILISIKWQDVSGTAEEKIPYDVISLIHSMLANGYIKAYIVLGGKGFKKTY